MVGWNCNLLLILFLLLFAFSLCFPAARTHNTNITHFTFVSFSCCLVRKDTTHIIQPTTNTSLFSSSLLFSPLFESLVTTTRWTTPVNQNKVCLFWRIFRGVCLSFFSSFSLFLSVYPLFSSKHFSLSCFRQEAVSCSCFLLSSTQNTHNHHRLSARVSHYFLCGLIHIFCFSLWWNVCVSGVINNISFFFVFFVVALVFCCVLFLFDSLCQCVIWFFNQCAIFFLLLFVFD